MKRLRGCKKCVKKDRDLKEAISLLKEARKFISDLLLNQEYLKSMLIEKWTEDIIRDKE